jgi:hypothetical protein
MIIVALYGVGIVVTFISLILLNRYVFKPKITGGEGMLGAFIWPITIAIGGGIFIFDRLSGSTGSNGNIDDDEDDDDDEAEAETDDDKWPRRESIVEEINRQVKEAYDKGFAAGFANPEPGPGMAEHQAYTAGFAAGLADQRPRLNTIPDRPANQSSSRQIETPVPSTNHEEPRNTD